MLLHGLVAFSSVLSIVTLLVNALGHWRLRMREIDDVVLLVLDSVTSTPQCIRQPRPRVYLKEGTYHTRLFRGPSTNEMKK